MIKKDRLYRDNMDKWSEKLKFKNPNLSQDKFNLARQLVDKLPDFLKNSPSQSFGYPDGGDQGAYYIEIKEERTIKKFHFDRDTSKLPNEIKKYIPEMQSILDQL